MRARVRAIVAPYLITTTENDIMLISQNSSQHLRICAARYGVAQAKLRISCASPNLRSNQHRSCRASTSTTAVQPCENFVQFGPCVRTADQRQASERGPAFAKYKCKYKCKTTRCEVGPPRFLLASWSAYSLSRSSEPSKNQNRRMGRDTEIQPSPRV